MSLSNWPLLVTLYSKAADQVDHLLGGGDATLLGELTGWRPEIPLTRTLSDLLAEAEAEAAAGA